MHRGIGGGNFHAVKRIYKPAAASRGTRREGIWYLLLGARTVGGRGNSERLYSIIQLLFFFFLPFCYFYW